MVVSDPEAMTKCILEAIKRSGVYAIMSKGWSDRLSVKKADGHATDLEVALPPEVFNIPSVPHDWLFANIDAACHHGGAGTTGASLRGSHDTLVISPGTDPTQQLVFLRSSNPSLAISTSGLTGLKPWALVLEFGSSLLRPLRQH